MFQVSVDSDESISTIASEAGSSVTEQTRRARNLMFKKKLKDKDIKIAEHEAEMKRKVAELSAKERVISERDDVIKSLSEQLEDLRKARSDAIKSGTIDVCINLHFFYGCFI